MSYEPFTLLSHMSMAPLQLLSPLQALSQQGKVPQLAHWRRPSPKRRHILEVGDQKNHIKNGKIERI